MQNIETLLGLDGASSQKKLLLDKNTVSLNPFMVENEVVIMENVSKQ